MSKRHVLLVACSAAALAIPLAVAGAGDAAAAPSPTGIAHRAAHVCATPAAGHAACESLVLVDRNGRPHKTSTPIAYGPSDLQGAYNLTNAAAAPESGTVAIVDAYDDPNAATDLAMYRSQYHLTSSSFTFTKVNQAGMQGPYPSADAGWAQEISLDLDMVSAICPNCQILLVEANSNSSSDLAAAVDTAAAQTGVVAISNSYGSSETATDSAYASAYAQRPGIAITASSGDSGYGVETPAAFPDVTAVGGTTLTQTTTGGAWSETAWSGAGSGCSQYVSQPAWQATALGSTKVHQCGNRVVADVSAVADPNTGVAVYDTYGQGGGGWLVFGGTSVASPIIASVYALAGGEPAGAIGAQSAYSAPAALNDITSGSNGSCPATTTGSTSTASGPAHGHAAAAASPAKGRPSPGSGGGGGTTAPNTYLCQAGTGYDGPTGLGTPNGTGAF